MLLIVFPKEISSMDEYEKIIKSDLPDVEKLAQAFQLITGRYAEQAAADIELARAMQDQESLVKEQIKLGMMMHARSIFKDCYRAVIGRMAWDE
jgi:hypothetical protein